MREGDNTYRPRDHINDSETKDISVVLAPPLSEAMSDTQTHLSNKRERDDTFRPRDTVPEEMIKAAEITVSPQVNEKDENGNAISQTIPEGGVASFWYLPVSFILSVFVLSALLVKFAFWLRDAFALPTGTRELALLGIALCAVVIFYAIGTLAMVFRNLPCIKQAAQKDASGKKVRDKDQATLLHAYLKAAFPDERDCNNYERQIVQVEGCSKKLRLLLNNIDDHKDWMDAFRAFEKIQDDAAENCIVKRAIWVFVKTGVSPWKIVDVMAVLYHAVVMTTEMAKIYRRKVTRIQAFRLTVDGLIAIGVASVAQDVLEKTAEVLTTKILTASSKLVNGFLGKVAPKVAEGSLNAVLVYRLGRRMQFRFRPLIEQAAPISSVRSRRIFTPQRLFVFFVVLAFAGLLALSRFGEQRQRHNEQAFVTCNSQEASHEIKEGK